MSAFSKWGLNKWGLNKWGLNSNQFDFYIHSNNDDDISIYLWHACLSCCNCTCVIFVCSFDTFSHTIYQVNSCMMVNTLSVSPLLVCISYRRDFLLYKVCMSTYHSLTYTTPSHPHTLTHISNPPTPHIIIPSHPHMPHILIPSHTPLQRHLLTQSLPNTLCCNVSKATLLK